MADPIVPTAEPHQTPSPPAVVDWRRLHALGLPGGSIRALLALVVFGTIWYWLWRTPETEVPAYLRDLMFIIMGHYFAVRQKTDASDAGPPPLFLPKGTIRSLLLLGFVAVAVLLYRREGFHVNDAWLTLLLVGGFMLGVLVNLIGGRRKWPRAFEDTRAIVSLSAGVLLVILVLHVWTPPADWYGLNRFIGKYKIEDILAAMVGFYFGSKS